MMKARELHLKIAPILDNQDLWYWFSPSKAINLKSTGLLSGYEEDPDLRYWEQQIIEAVKEILEKSGVQYLTIYYRCLYDAALLEHPIVKHENGHMLDLQTAKRIYVYELHLILQPMLRCKAFFLVGNISKKILIRVTPNLGLYIASELNVGELESIAAKFKLKGCGWHPQCQVSYYFDDELDC